MCLDRMGVVNRFPKGELDGQKAKSVYAQTWPAHENDKGINSRIITHDSDSFAASNVVSIPLVGYKSGLRNARF
jgi:hypothetical protein